MPDWLNALIVLGTGLLMVLLTAGIILTLLSKLRTGVFRRTKIK